ncbi:hypothetical protein [Hyalangium minutum]|uniref:Uncharacterized protein n=1 Tax=Hyalangium minutum TaxID=394096 RepID=A0A085W3S9_9BACT|nr:hypothetical protein [Hyalangium minutum]KFE62342.1 hypothetical protein DB31_4052 [Hyalangium minutum]
MRKNKLKKKLASIHNFLRAEVEAGELELGFMQEVERSLVELSLAVEADDYQMVKVAINEAAKKFRR